MIFAEYRTPQRVNCGFFASHEKACLIWMAARTPVCISPNHLTALGVLGALIIGVANIASFRSPYLLLLACFGLLLNWLGDSLDGTVARVREVQRHNFGFFIDHTSDLFSQVIMILTLGASPYVHFGAASLVLVAYLVASAYTYISLYVSNDHVLSHAKIGPTELRVALIAFYLFIFFNGNSGLPDPFGEYSIYDGILVLFGAMTLIAICSAAVRQALLLNAQDPPKPMSAMTISRNSSISKKYAEPLNASFVAELATSNSLGPESAHIASDQLRPSIGSKI